MMLSKKIIIYFAKYFQRIRISLFKNLSDKNVIVEGNPIIRQPVQFLGTGKISFGLSVMLGYFPSPGFYNGLIYLEARNDTSIISFGNNIMVNNNLVICCDKTSITIGDDVLIGTNVEIIDSDFHNLNPLERRTSNYECLPVEIGNNVFIGSNVKILKGVHIGDNSVIGNSSLVIENIPANVIAAGSPAKVIRHL